ncbi:MAG: ABC transporter substrate-binding protein [Immundisolibacteraceae bacterium]|nr:ABC transporter substrate-binding protein [Immundisolibacteraceae bacterium]
MDSINWGSPPVGLFNFPLDLWTEQGQFADRGIDLNTHTHLTGQEYGNNIRQGVYDMGHIGTPVFLPAAVGSDEYAVISIGVCDYAPFYFVADPAVGSLADCKGEAFVINKFKTCPHSLLKWHARQHGLSEHDFQAIELMADSQFDNYGMAFLDGVQNQRFRAGILYEPYVSMIEREFGWRVLGDYPEIARPANYAILLYARRSWIEHKPELVKKMMTAYFDCAASGRDNVEGLADYAEKFPFIQPADVRSAISRETRHWQLKPGLDWDLLKRVEVELVEQQLVPGDYQIKDYIAEVA